MTHASLCKKTYKNTWWFQAVAQTSSIALLSTHKQLIARLFASLCILAFFLSTGNSLLGSPPPATPITVTTTSLPDAVVGQPYSDANGTTVQLKAKGGSGSFGWIYPSLNVVNVCPLGSPEPGTMEATYQGLSFNCDGTITGTPTIAGAIAFTTEAHNPVTGKNFSPLTPLTITVGACTSTTITPASPLPGGEVGVPYAGAQFVASGCPGPYTYSLSALNPLGQNTFPAGLSFTASSALLLGTPTLAGTFNLVLTATDPYQEQTPMQYAITILPPPSITTPSPLPGGIVNVAYSEQIAATGGTPPYIYSMNAQPPGIVNIDPNKGILYGTPSKTGTYSFNIGVTDSLGVQTVVPFQVTFTAVASQLQVTPTSLTFNANLNGNPPPSQAIALVPANGATPPVTFTDLIDAGQSGSTAPSWITLTPASGTSPAGLVVSVNQGAMPVGTYTARIQVLDPIGVPTDIPVTLNVSSGTQQLTVAPVMLNFAALSSAPGNFTQNLLVSNTGGGSLPFNTSIVSGNALFSSVATTPNPTNPNAPALLQVQVNTNGLQVGAYHDTILVSSASGTMQVPVSLFVSGSGPILALNTSGVLFQAIARGASTVTQNVEVLNRGDSSSTVNWTATLISGSNWLTLVSSTGTATGVNPGILSLALGANATQLSPGPYYALVEIADSNALDSPQYVTAVLNLQASTSALAAQSRSSRLVLYYVRGERRAGIPDNPDQ